MFGFPWLRSLLLCSVIGVFAEESLHGQVVRLLGYGKVWRYEASGIDLGDAWLGTNFDDSAWPSGAGALGAPSNENLLNLASVMTDLPLLATNGGARVITYYFRTRFDYPGDPRGVMLLASNLVDDGAVFYLNGAEAGRVGMPAGAITYSRFSLRTDDVASRPGPDVLLLAASNLVQGANTLAVEVHQGTATSADVAFAMSLTALVPTPLVITNEPVDQVVEVESPAAFAVGVSGSHPQYRWFKDGQAISITNSSFTIPRVQTNDAGAYFVTVSNGLGSVTSHVARLTVVPDVTGPVLLTAEDFNLITGTIVLTFSEALAQTIARERTNYSVKLAGSSDSLAITQMLSSVRQVQLRLAEPLHPDDIYVVTVNNIQDTRGNAVVPNSQVAVAFYRPVVPMDGLWRYDGAGLDLGTAWRDFDYDDGDWPVAAAPFFFGAAPPPACAGPGNTAVVFGPTTFYFRALFGGGDTTGRGSLRFRHTVDDGAVYYLNGLEVLRVNMPPGLVTANTFAATPIGVPGCISPPTVPVTNLASRGNVIAVELHQANPHAADLIFATEVLAAVQPAIPEIFKLAIRQTASPDLLRLEWTPGTAILQSAPALNGPWADEPTRSPSLLSPTNATVFYRLRSP